MSSYYLQEDGVSKFIEEDSSGDLIIEDGGYLPVLGTTNPSILVQLDWTNDPTIPVATWEDVTAYLVSYSRQPVRTNEFDQPSPATATIVLRNDDSRFTPDNINGLYYPGLKPYRRMRVLAQWAGVVYPRYYGYVTDWPQSWDDNGLNQTVTLSLVDNLAPLEVFDLQGKSFASKVSGPAIQDVLTAAGIAASSLDPGNSTIVASGTLGTGSYAAQHLKDIAASENGVVYADGAGVVNFHDRHRRLTGGASVNVQATIGDGGGSEIPYTAPTPASGDVWSTVQVTPNGGTVQTATSTAATASFFNRTLNFPTGGTYLVASASEASQAGNYLLNRYSTPLTSVPSVTLIGTQTPSLWSTILSLDTGSRVIFKRAHFPGAGSTVSLNQFVEGFGDEVTIGQDWRVTVPLSPADTQSYWVLGDLTYGVLGSTTRIVY